jgi:glycosyltransferase involved in cell wall biosynthesis
MQTLPVNLFEGKRKIGVEFILLNYNSTDDLDSFIAETMADHLKSGLLKYYKTLEPQYFHRSHSRNLAFKLASGDILCNLDADNYLSSDFIDTARKEFNGSPDIFLTSVGSGGKNLSRDVLGKICVKKPDFLFIRGYDERMEFYGFEDIDLINRLKIKNLKPIAIKAQFLKALDHSIHERIENEFVSKNFYRLYFKFLTPFSTEVLFLLRNNTYCMATIIDNHRFSVHNSVNKVELQSYEFSLLSDKWERGTWDLRKNNLTIVRTNGEDLNYLVDDGKKTLSNGSNIFIECLNEQMMDTAILFLSETTNRSIMDDNLQKQKVSVNQSGFGNGIVFKNFDLNTPIVVH